MKTTPVRPETNYPKSNIPYRTINQPFRFGFIIPGDGISIEKDSNGVLCISSENGIENLIAGDNIELAKTDDGKIIVSVVSTISNVAAGDNVTVNIDPETGTAVINSVIGDEVNEHYQGVFDTSDDLIEHDYDPEDGDYGLIKNVTYSDGGDDSWNGQYKYCFYINGAWTIVDQMLTFTSDTDLIQRFYSVGGSSPVIYLHKVSYSGSYNDLSHKPIVATPEVVVEGNTITVSCATDGAEIYYTTDGSMPHAGSTLYSGPITVVAATTFRFVGIKNGLINSLEAVASADYDLQDPEISLDYRTGEITMSNPNLSGSVYYTTDGSTPTALSNLYSGPFVISNDTLLRAIVINNNDNTESNVVSKRYDKCATPRSHSTSSNWINGNTSRAFVCDTENSAMHYTLDGSTPDYQSELCNGIIYSTIYDELNIKIMAIAEGYIPSGIAEFSLGYDKPSSPSISFDSNTNTVIIARTGESVNIAPSAYKIYYTTDGSTPTAQSILYKGPVPVTDGMTVKAVLVAYDEYFSNVASLEITILKMPGANFNENTGALTLLDLNTGGTIHYTTDGSEPTSDSTVYTQPIVLNESTTVKCISVVENVGQSKVAVYGYEQAARPAIAQSNLNLSTGDYQIVMTADSKWKKIHYTLDGSTPTYQSPIYSAPISKNIFDGEVNVKAIVIYSEQVPSQVASETFGESAVSAPEITVNDETDQVAIELSENTVDIPLQTNNNVPTLGARIYYTTDGSVPTAQNGTLYTGEFSIPQGTTVIKAVTVCYGEYSSAVKSTLPTSPQISLDYKTGYVTMVNPDGTGDIYYTTDGSTPTAQNGTLYSSPILISAQTNFKAVVVYAGKTSEIASITFGKASVSATTSINYTTGTISMQASSPTPNAEYRHTSDGSNPNYSSENGNTVSTRLYGSVITGKIMVFAEGFVPSVISSNILGYSKPSTPLVSYSDGYVTMSKAGETSSCPALMGDIYYTEDGSTPDCFSTRYTQQILIQSSETVKAVFAYDMPGYGFVYSDVVEEEIVIQTDEIEYYDQVAQDLDGNYYDAVLIGNNVWLASNLRTQTAVPALQQDAYAMAGNMNYYYKAQYIQQSTSFINEWRMPSQADVDNMKVYLREHGYVSGDFYDNLSKSIASKYQWMNCVDPYTPGYNSMDNNSALLDLQPVGRVTGISPTSLQDEMEKAYFLLEYAMAVVMLSYDDPEINIDMTFDRQEYYPIRLVSTLTVAEFRQRYESHKRPSNN